jgi:pre-mRNA-processing factor 17
VLNAAPIKKTDEQKELRKKRKEASGIVEDVDSYLGPWGTYYYADKEEMPEPNEEQKEWAAQQETKKAKRVPGDGEAEEEEMEEQSEFHGKELYDFQGKSYISPPTGLKVPQEANKSFIPKKLLHTWTGHKKGVSAIQFFPNTGHLLLSASMDSSVKLWNVNGDRKCIRTFWGHTEAVRGVDFNHDGTR